MKKISRRTFSLTIGKGITGTAILGGTSFACANTNAKKKTKLGIALVGLGSYSTYQLAPSLLDTQHCFLAAIVTGTKEKEALWKAKYKLPDNCIYNYENFDAISKNPDIDIVYVVLPNSMHAEFCMRAAKAGKHVICEN